MGGDPNTGTDPVKYGTQYSNEAYMRDHWVQVIYLNTNLNISGYEHIPNGHIKPQTLDACTIEIIVLTYPCI